MEQNSEKIKLFQLLLMKAKKHQTEKQHKQKTYHLQSV